MNVIKKRWKYILTAIIALIIGAAMGPTQEELDVANSKVKDFKKELSSSKEVITTLKSEKDALQSKVDEAAPFFKLSEMERNKAAAQAAEKEKEAKEKEEAAKLAAEKEAAAKEKAKQDAKLAARTKTFSAGKYTVGTDIEPGIYNAKAIAGDGNFFVNEGMKVNEMFGVSGDFYNDSYNNVDLQVGDTINLNNNLQVKFTPVN